MRYFRDYIHLLEIWVEERRQLVRQHSKSLNPTTTQSNEKSTPVLEDCDTTINNLNDDVDALLATPDAPAKPLATLTRRAIGIIFLLIWFTVIYLGTIQTLELLGDKTEHIIDALRATAANKYGDFSEAYDLNKNPTSREEVAGILTEFYQLLADMAYYDSSIIDRPPYNPGINKTLAAELGFSQEAIEMMNMMPYLNTSQGDSNVFAWGDGEFLFWGEFTDLRNDGNLDLSRDPFYAVSYDENGKAKDWNEDGGKYMRPDHVCLSNMGNHGTVLILDVKTLKLWTINQIDGNMDPALQDISRDLGVSGNIFAPENSPSRLARDALREYMQNFRTLEWMPGGFAKGSWDGDEMARLYKENGWPKTFNRTAFKIAKSQWEEDSYRQGEQEQPYQEVMKLEMWISSSSDSIHSDQEKIKEVDAGKELPPDMPDRQAYRKQLEDKIRIEIGHLFDTQKDLDTARKVIKGLDPEVRRLREERVKKYGF